jgi:putrescine:ornithine antiporter
MNLAQLTFIVAVNMMGSGIIMLPTNMAQVGAISLLSWVVTAIGSMAIAYGFAQAGLFNQRDGGMSAYAEDAYGKSGYFLVFYLYFLSLAIGNVAIASSAVGYLATFVPWLSSTPIATCIGVIGLLWLTTVANFGGPGSPVGSGRSRCGASSFLSGSCRSPAGSGSTVRRLPRPGIRRV